MRRLILSIVAVSVCAVSGCGRDPEALKAMYAQKGDQFVAEKKYKEAVIEYRNAIQQDPRFAAVRVKLAEVYLNLEDGPNALKEYVRAADLLPDDVAVQLRTGDLLLLASLFPEAQARAEQALRKDPSNALAHIVLANAQAGQRRGDDAVKELQKAIELDPSKPRAYLDLGVVELSLGHRDRAESAFKNALMVAPRAPNARISLANFYTSVDRRSDAEQTLTEGLKLDPQNPALTQAMALFYLAGNEFEKAKPFLDRNTSAPGADRSVAQFALVDYYLRHGQKEEAVKVLSAFEPSATGYPMARFRLAGIRAAEGRRDEARKILAALLQQTPNFAPALAAQAQILFEEQKFAEASAQAKAAVSADERLPEAHYVLAMIEKAEGNPEAAIQGFNEVLKYSPAHVPSQLELSKLHMLQGHADAAVDFGQQAVKNAPSSYDARLTLARALIARREIGRAESELKQAVALDPKNPAGHVQTGVLAIMKQDARGSRAAFERALTLDPDNVDAIKGLIVLDIATRNVNAAIARANAAITKRPNSAELLLSAANAYASAGNAAKTEEMLKKAVLVDSNSLQAYQRLGQFYAEAGRLKEAETQFESLAKRQPKSVTAQTMAAMLIHLQKDEKRAQKRYEEILALDPNAAIAANNLAFIQAERSDNLDLALQLAQTAKSKLPDEPEINDTLGWVYYKKNLASLALPPLKQSVVKEPANYLYQYHYGLALAKAGNKPEAGRALQEALRLKPDFEGAATAKQVLASLNR